MPRHRKSQSPRRRGGLPAARGSAADALTRELNEALDRQAATAEILSVISKSPRDTQPVFDAIVRSGSRLFADAAVFIALPDGEMVRAAALAESDPARAEAWRQRFPFPLTRDYMHGIAILDGRTVDLPDVANAPPGLAIGAKNFLASGYRAITVVPMMRDSRAIGTLSVVRLTPGPLTGEQLALLQTFAEQAVIAIENVRLLNDLRQRTSDLSEALDRQTATSDVLKVISSSAGELRPVFDTLLQNATRICRAAFGNLALFEGDQLRMLALHGPQGEFADLRRRDPVVPVSQTPVRTVVETKQPVQINDLAAEAEYADLAIVKLGGARTIVVVPMLKDNDLIGAISVFRQEVAPFSDKQIELLTNFASQAVIAIENARLLNDLRQRTTDLSEALEYQTATGEILASITASINDPKPVFDAIVRNLQRLFGTPRAQVQILKDGQLHLGAAATEEEFDTVAAVFPRPLDEDSGGGRAFMTKQVQLFVPVRGNAAAPPLTQRMAKELDFDAAIFAPMMRGDEVIGVIGTVRREPIPFSDKQVALIKAFADQAVIAIENSRLLNELRAKTDELRQLNEHLEKRVSDQVTEIERMGRLRRFLPPQVADLIVSLGAEQQLESHRREITALFCDLRGFTGFSESADPEDVMALLGEYHAAIGKIIFKHGGTLERFVGDGVMVIFNDPIPLENPSLHAVQMALDLRTAIGALTETWRRMGHELGFGIGIAHGYATLGTIGFEGRYDYAAIGTVSNVASRLCDEAKPGQILISPRVHTAVEGAVVVEPAGELVLKGIRRPLEVYNVVSLASQN